MSAVGIGIGLPFGASRVLSVLSDIPGIVSEWSPSISKLYQDDEGTVPASSAADPIAYIQDLIGANHLLQTVDGSRLTLRKTTLNNRDVAEGDGADDSVFKAFTLNQACWTAVVGRYLTLNGDLIFAGQTAARYAGYNAGGIWNMYAGTALSSAVAATVNVWKVVICIFNGASSKILVNGGTIQTGNAGAGNLGGICVLKEGGGAFNAHGQFAHGACGTGALSDTNINLINTRLCDRYGLTP